MLRQFSARSSGILDGLKKGVVGLVVDSLYWPAHNLFTMTKSSRGAICPVLYVVEGQARRSSTFLSKVCDN